MGMTDLLVLGATGVVGGAVLRLALEEPRILRVIAPTRRALPLQHQRLTNPLIDFESLDEKAPWWKVDAVVSALGTTRALTSSEADYERIETSYPVKVARLVRERGVRAFAYVSSTGASSKSRWFYLRTKGQTEARLREVGFPSLTVVRPSGIIGRRHPRRRPEEITLGAYQVLRPVLPRRWRAVTGSQVAGSLLNAVLDAEDGIHIIESEALQV
jgi:uncharacterized protein YbjT (DUF2867 family)